MAIKIHVEIHSVAELEAVFALIRSEPLTPEQLAAITARMKDADDRAQAQLDAMPKV